MVDAAKKTKALVYDPTKLAASLTAATGLPYDSQHLPITTIRFVKGEQVIQFEVNVPRDANIPGEKKTTVNTSTDNDNQGQDDDSADGALDVPQQTGGRGSSLFGPAPARNQKQLVVRIRACRQQAHAAGGPSRAQTRMGQRIARR